MAVEGCCQKKGRERQAKGQQCFELVKIRTIDHAKR